MEYKTMLLMSEVFTELGQMSYVENSIRHSTHEIEVSMLLEKHGFERKENKNLSKACRDKIRKGNQDIMVDKGRYYFFQPMGTHDVPDFIVVDNGVPYFLECKSGKEDKVSWNTSLPKKDYIYLFACQKYNSSTLFLGQHHMNEELEEIYCTGIERIREYVKELNQQLKEHPSNTHGYSYYPRNMFIQMGGNQKTSIISNPNRERYFLETIEFVREKEKILT